MENLKYFAKHESESLTVGFETEQARDKYIELNVANNQIWQSCEQKDAYQLIDFNQHLYWQKRHLIHAEAYQERFLAFQEHFDKNGSIKGFEGLDIGSTIGGTQLTQDHIQTLDKALIGREPDTTLIPMKQDRIAFRKMLEKEGITSIHDALPVQDGDYFIQRYKNSVANIERMQSVSVEDVHKLIAESQKDTANTRQIPKWASDQIAFNERTDVDVIHLGLEKFDMSFRHAENLPNGWGWLESYRKGDALPINRDLCAPDGKIMLNFHFEHKLQGNLGRVLLREELDDQIIVPYHHIKFDSFDCNFYENLIKERYADYISIGEGKTDIFPVQVKPSGITLTPNEALKIQARLARDYAEIYKLDLPKLLGALGEMTNVSDLELDRKYNAFELHNRIPRGGDIEELLKTRIDEFRKTDVLTSNSLPVEAKLSPHDSKLVDDFMAAARKRDEAFEASNLTALESAQLNTELELQRFVDEIPAKIRDVDEMLERIKNVSALGERDEVELKASSGESLEDKKTLSDIMDEIRSKQPVDVPDVADKIPPLGRGGGSFER